jgi:hypothetical protein
MKRNLEIILMFFIVLALGLGSVSAQFTLKIPGIKIAKPDREQPKNKNIGTTGKADAKTSNSKNIYETTLPTNVPVLLKNSVYVQAKTQNEYWKLPNERNHSSWVPDVRFESFYNNEENLNYTVEYFNPDGTSWFSEKLEQGRSAADRTVRFESSETYEALNSKSTDAVGTYSFKITDRDSNKVIYQGKFKVAKFSTNGGPKEKKFDFYVDHDWLLPFGMIGFHHAGVEVGGIPPLVSVWLKGPVSADELEGRLFYKGQQIASTKDGDGESGVSDYDERATQFAPSHSPLNYWKRWQFQWGNFRFDNNGPFNRDYYPKALYADKNPGDYTVKIFRNGTQIRELGFSIGSDGRFVAPAYTEQIYMPYHRIILPVKVIGTAEKWNAVTWKTDAFYGNPLTGFTVQ